jgi:hypothetical protein
VFTSHSHIRLSSVVTEAEGTQKESGHSFTTLSVNRISELCLKWKEICVCNVKVTRRLVRDANYAFVWNFGSWSVTIGHRLVPKRSRSRCIGLFSGMLEVSGLWRRVMLLYRAYLWSPVSARQLSRDLCPMRILPPYFPMQFSLPISCKSLEVPTFNF